MGAAMTLSPTDFRYGFRVMDGRHNQRRPTDAGRAWAGHAACDPECEPHRECYLSAFQFDGELYALLNRTGSTAGYSGPCWSPWLWLDVDRDGDEFGAIDAARRLCVTIIDTLAVRDADLLTFYSGRKGYHLGIPTAIWSPLPGPEFNSVARQFAERVAERAGVAIDTGVYDRVRLFRAPNSRHPKTGLHKRQISVDELMEMAPTRIAELAQQPAPFETPTPVYHNESAAALWAEAARHVHERADAAARKAAIGEPGRLNRATLEFIRDGAAVGDRHRLLYSAAANLAEFGASQALCVALLDDAARDSGLPPKDIQRTIQYGRDSVRQRPGVLGVKAL